MIIKYILQPFLSECKINFCKLFLSDGYKISGGSLTSCKNAIIGFLVGKLFLFVNTQTLTKLMLRRLVELLCRLQDFSRDDLPILRSFQKKNVNTLHGCTAKWPQAHSCLSLLLSYCMYSYPYKYSYFISLR